MFENTGMTLGPQNAIFGWRRLRIVDSPEDGAACSSAIIFCLNRGCSAGVRHPIGITKPSVAVGISTWGIN